MRRATHPKVLKESDLRELLTAFKNNPNSTETMLWCDDVRALVYEVRKLRKLGDDMASDTHGDYRDAWLAHRRRNR